ncbi:hypothetical protein JCM6882_006857 [Rhodosporidiobolus microsporus]
MSSTCLPTPSSNSTVYTLSAASQLPTAGPYSSAARDAFVERNGTRLQVDGQGEFKVVGPNVYWLGLDENVDPNPSYPSKSRVLEAMAVASVMGATTIRSQSLGISVGTGLSIENALGTFKANDSAAWDAVDFAVYAARQYNLRLILPLTDQYDYYHGGIKTFLRWRNLSDSDFSRFYDTANEVYSDFVTYVRTLLGHISPYTNLSLSTDPTILAFETGNELGGWTGRDYPPPVEWTRSVARLLKELAPRTLVVSGSYGVRRDELGIEEVDIHSDHFYPLYTSRLSRSSSLASSSPYSKPFLAGEYDWTNALAARLQWAWWAMALPVVVAAVVGWVGCGCGGGCCRRRGKKERGWPVRTSLRGILTCGGCGRRGKRRREKGRAADAVTAATRGDGGGHDPREDEADDAAYVAEERDKSLFSSSTSALPILSSSPSSISFPPPSSPYPPPPSSSRPPRTSSSFLDRPLLLRKWHLSLLILAVSLPILGALLHTYLPSSISSFLSQVEDLTSREKPAAVGDLYWSLFGRDDHCCGYVQHADGYTLHYPSDPAASSGQAGRGSGEGVVRLTRHAWTVRGERPYWMSADEGKEVRDVGLGDLPVVACPQEGVRLANGTVVGGSGGS